jgi:hypothetical protein
MKNLIKNSLGDYPTIRVIEFMIQNKDTSYGLVELRNFAHVGYSTLKLIIPKLLNADIIYVEKEVSKSRLYRINQENILVQSLMFSNDLEIYKDKMKRRTRK